MRGFRRFLGVKSKKLSFVAGLVVAAVGLLGSVGLVGNVVYAGPDCDNNALIKCGFTDRANFIDLVKANNSKNGHSDLQAIYSYFNLPASEYGRFISSAQEGEVRRTGEIVVNNQVVATGAKSIGRIASYHGSGYFSMPINGAGTYYGNTVDKTFAPGTQSIPAYVLFDASGTAQFTVLKSCGNVVFGTKVNTSASCTSLNAVPVQGKINTYNFTATAVRTGNATIKSFVYDFGDGSPTKVMTDGSIPVSHTYTKTGDFKATVTVYASVPGNSNLQLPSVSMCAKKITVELPACVELSGIALDRSKMSYTFKVTANPTNSAAFTGADFDFGDGKVQTGVQPATPTTAVVTHQYAASGQYDATAILHFNANGAAVTAPACKANVTPENVTPECKPGVPVGSAECTPCQYDTSLPSNSDKCVPPPPDLPKTGAGNTIAIFATVVIGGFLVYRQLLFRKHRAAFVAAEQGTSPLPLAEPLETQAPLVHTPAKKFSLRRRRQF